uniref:Uncharacterized protein n=1 Tax=Neisseria polysaccharea TaxID=489 RepID=A7ISB6_NEIPO|nr:hypothetical protein [Neisseria polysaccharea]
MSLIFTKDFFKDGSNDRFGVFETNDNLAWLGSFLMDDGGVGVLHLLKMSESLLKEIQENASSPRRNLSNIEKILGSLLMAT